MATETKKVGSTTFTKETKDVQQAPETKEPAKVAGEEPQEEMVSMTALDMFAHPGGACEVEADKDAPTTGHILQSGPIKKGQKFKVPKSIAEGLEKAKLATTGSAPKEETRKSA